MDYNNVKKVISQRQSLFAQQMAENASIEKK